jgi:hypothetical protein
MFSLHATKKLLDRVKAPVMPPVSEPTTALGNWYGTVLFWKPQVALLVNEQTLYPVMMPLAPATTLMARFPEALQQSLEAGGVPAGFIEAEIAGMVDGRYAKTANRSVIGIMNEFSFLATGYCHLLSEAGSLPRDRRDLRPELSREGAPNCASLRSDTPSGHLRRLKCQKPSWSAARPAVRAVQWREVFFNAAGRCERSRDGPIKRKHGFCPTMVRK